MTDKTADELHNELMDYPCKFTIKTMGYSHVELDLIVVEIIRRHIPQISEKAVQSKFSKSKKYISLSISITAQSKQQMDAIYRDLSDCEHVLMSL
ncbi:MAG: transcriptional regulator [Cycloclasticus sp. symbiont of Poecilosclerida sp. N]|nr:MAG: transcriptional regulator [Cycloclasticus sp. symbiont of Poecilosclerida sp. N]